MAKGHKTGGRKAGTPNKITAELRTDVRLLAMPYGPRSIELLAAMAGLTRKRPADSEMVRVACAKELLERAYGKATQPIGSDPDRPVVFQWATPVLTAAVDAARDVTVAFERPNGANGHDANGHDA